MSVENLTALTPRVAQLIENSIALSVQTAKGEPDFDAISRLVARSRLLVQQVCVDALDIRSLAAVLSTVALTAGGDDADLKHILYMIELEKTAKSIESERG